ncbi:MAG TPA: alpha/beta fold hydrolase [Beutenbergiaceae bacterium]|nr:alpha/beta fold hydrolase [Beutenbergiaceae bacterium]
MTPAPMTPQRSYAMPGMWVSEYTLEAPLDWRNPDGEQLQLFVRELVDPDRRDTDLPLATYLQGGPGGANPRPLTGAGGWLGEALEHYRVVLVDQRGTGRSTPVEADDVAALGSAAAGADYLAKFRADSIVRDLEHVRRHVYRGRKWVTIGQSFGGWITLTYLSHAPEALAASYIFGGTPGIPPDAAEVYRRTFTRVEQKTAEFYRRYPQDVATVAQVADHLAAHEVRLPDGDHLTVRRFQTLGRDLGMKPGHERLHWLLETAFSRPGRLSAGFLEQVQARTSSAGNPLYWTLQESIYADEASGPTDWAAQRERDRRPEFAEDRRPLLFTGEMAFPWMFEEIRTLRGFAPAVAELARRRDWSPLYEVDRLAANDVPVAAAVYYDDMYVDAHLQLDTLAKVGNSQYWVTNEYEHDGVTSEGTFAYLRDLVRDRGGEHW